MRESACLTVEDRRRLDNELCADPNALEASGDARITAEAKKIAYRLDPQAVVDHAAKAPRDRYVSVRPAPEGMAFVTACVPMPQGVAVCATLDKAVKTNTDDRTRGQVMADTLVERVTGRPAEEPVPPVTVNVVLSDDTLVDGGNHAATVEGYGPVPADVARSLITDSSTTTARSPCAACTPARPAARWSPWSRSRAPSEGVGPVHPVPR